MKETVCHHLYKDCTITCALYKDVHNAKELRQSVMNGDFEATLLKTSMVCSDTNFGYTIFFGNILLICWWTHVIKKSSKSTTGYFKINFKSWFLSMRCFTFRHNFNWQKMQECC
jgi:hypothetical protein